jgi:alkaline phosphatase
MEAMGGRRVGWGPRLAAALALMSGLACAVAAGDPDPWFEAGRAAVERAPHETSGGGRARNVVFFVGDGMGIGTVTAARILEGQQRGESGEENELSFDRFPYVALLKTYETNQQVPDSAGTMTAMMAGVKTKARVLGLDDRAVVGDHRSVERSRVRSLFEEAEVRGLSTGVVTTTTLTHATPAATYAHSPSREWEDDSELSAAARADGFPDLARQFVEFSAGDGIDVALAGGRQHFLPRSEPDPEYPELRGARLDGRDLVKEWLARHPGGVYVWNRAQLEAVDPARTRQLLGLFEASHMHFEVDRKNDRAGEPSLAEMTVTAIDILSRNPKGFLLVVEGGRIDHGHHVSNAYRALTETIALSDAVRAAVSHTDPAETLVVVTADHGHALTLSGFPTRGNDVLGLVVENDAQGRPEKEPARDATGRPYTTLGYANGPGYTGASDSQPEGPKHFYHDPHSVQGIRNGRPDLSQVDTTAPDYLQETTVPLAQSSHTGEDVALYATGPGASLFHGVQEQSYVRHAIAGALGWPEADAPAR